MGNRKRITIAGTRLAECIKAIEKSDFIRTDNFDESTKQYLSCFLRDVISRFKNADADISTIKIIAYKTYQPAINKAKIRYVIRALEFAARDFNENKILIAELSRRANVSRATLHRWIDLEWLIRSSHGILGIDITKSKDKLQNIISEKS
ncbi:hypothetical protein [Alistipes sp.]|uniref:hypothetical protein n=1 Tax=Alistipes sp. TaxID=1872444 RepID=UPI003AB4D54A